MSNSTISHRAGKPKFPLWHHKASGRWCKKVGAKFHYFSRVADDPKGEQSLDEWSRFKNGDTPKPTNSGKALTLRELCNRWLEFKEQLLDSGELSTRTFSAYYASASFLLTSLGKYTKVADLGPEDFQRLRGRMAKIWGPIRLKNQMAVVEGIFRFGAKNELFEKKVRFGSAWVKPTAKTLRKHRAALGPRMFEATDLRKTLDLASTNLEAMILLAINGGLGNTDLALVPIKAIDLESGWLDYARNKTGIMRRIPLFPETVKAVREVLKERREPRNPDNAGLLFITPKRGETYLGGAKCYKISKEMAELLQAAGVEGRSFYDLRRTFQTISEEAGDLAATQSVMGHAASSSDMSSLYRQRISDKRLCTVVAHVRGWLFPESLEVNTEGGER